MITTRSFVIGSLFTVTIALVMLGVIMVLSSSFMEPNVYEYMGKQLIWFSVGLAAMFYFFNIDFNVWEGWSRWILLGTLFLLTLVFFFPEVNGARRWIRFAGFTFQPFDLAKLAVIFYLSAIWADREDLLDSFKQGVFWPLSIVGFLLFLIVLEPDHGTTFFIGMISMAIWFIAGGRFRHMVPIFVALVAGVLFALFLKPNLWVRLDAFLRPELYETTKAYQLKNSLIGFANGGLWGVGIGEGEQKLGFTPEPHTDYIFSTLGEELGFVKCALVLGAFACI
ncbi:hypothetical protein GF373_17160, partial [bacterium]|nr:hypothetical protein [bacterium]